MKYKKVIDGIEFDVETPQVVVDFILNERKLGNRTRIRIWYGDPATGKSWEDENDIMGRLGFSTGNPKLPLLIHNLKSMGGGAILTENVLKLVDISTRRVIYKHEKFHQKEYTFIGSVVYADGVIYSRHHNRYQAAMMAAFMNGKRHRKW